MERPPVDTFEHDIADEIRHKEASVADIASAVGDIGNTPKTEPTSHSSVLISIVTILVLCGVAGLGFVGYLYYSGKYDPTASTKQETKTEQPSSQKPNSSLDTLSPTLKKNIGDYVTAVQKNNLGYTLTITSYPPVFAYMIKNENAYSDELGKALSSVVKATTTPKAPQVVNASTSDLVTSSSTTVSPPEEVIPENYIFTDVTLNNQNMRIATSVNGTVVYAFVGVKTLLVSSSVDGILALRANILTK